MVLRPYQQEGYKEIFTSWEIFRIVMFVLCTGGGKTVIFTEVIKTLLFQGKRGMLIAHREELITQAWNTLYRNQIYAGIIKGDYPTDYSLPCQVASIQTLSRRKSLPECDFIIIDEGHHVTDANTYQKIIKLFPKAKILIVTATPYRLSGEGFQEIVKGEHTHLIINSTLGTLINNGWLVPIDYFVASIPDLSGVHLNRGDYQEDELEKVMEMAPLIESYFQHVPGKCGLVFAVNVSHSKNIVSRYNYAGVPAVHLDANTPADQRKQVFSDFNAGLIKIISNVGIAGEGTDIPNVEFIQKARPTKSLSVNLQQDGRVVRALAGVVDNPSLTTAEQRKGAIASSAKPAGIILDNAGLWVEHGMPWDDHNWKKHFIGKNQWKKEQPVEAGKIEMLVFEYEDAAGGRKKTMNPQEIEGLKLIKVSKQVENKIVNLRSLKEFERIYNMYCNMPKIKSPAYVAFDKYLEYCKKNNHLVVPEMWDVMEWHMIKKHEKTFAEMLENRKSTPSMYPDVMIDTARKRLNSMKISKKDFLEVKLKYTQDNADQLAEYLTRNTRA